MTKIKICGLKTSEDIGMINELAPDYCGFIIDFPKSHRSRTPDEVRGLVAELDRAKVKAVGVFVNAKEELVAELLRENVLDLAQLHGDEDEEYLERLRSLLPNEKKNCMIKAFRIREKEDFEKALASSADYILLDQGQGGGSTFDWSMVDPERIDRPWFLAGGISAENGKEAVRMFHPTAVDLSSAVETDQKKDPAKVKEMIDLIRSLPE